MRVELPAPLKPGQQFIFKLTGIIKLLIAMNDGGRGGYEYFPGRWQSSFHHGAMVSTALCVQ